MAAIATVNSGWIWTDPAPALRPAHWPTGALNPDQFYDEYREWQANPAAYTPPPPPVAP